MNAIACVVLASCAVKASPVYMVEYVIDGTGFGRTPPLERVRYQSRVKGEHPGRPESPVAVRVEDDIALFEWVVFDNSIQVRITNKSNSGDSTRKRLVVLRDRAEYVDPDGRTHDLVPYGYSRSTRHPSPVIEPGESRAYGFFPEDFSVQHRALFGGPIPGRVVERAADILDLYKDHVGKSFRMRLPIRVKEIATTDGDHAEVVYEYKFDMTVSEVRPRLVRKGTF